MIEINLLPGSVKRTKRKIGIGLPAGLSTMKMPKLDRILAASIGMTVVGIGLILYMQLGGSAKLKAAKLEEGALQRDTARLSAELIQSAALSAKQDTIARKLTVIQQLDGARFNWAHILDEISRAVPDYTWLVSIMPADADNALPAFKIEGRMGNAFALPKFIQDLESSPFIANVTLRGSDPVTENRKSLYSFTVEAQYEVPPMDVIRTEPLFGPDMEPDSAIGAAVTEQKAGAQAPPATPPAANAGAKPPVKQTPPPVKKAGKE